MIYEKERPKGISQSEEWSNENIKSDFPVQAAARSNFSSRVSLFRGMSVNVCVNA